MNYHDSVERSTQFLRQALPLMSRQGAALHPKSYAVWYEYVSGQSLNLRAAVDDHIAKHGQLDESGTDVIFRKFIADVDPVHAKRVTDGVNRILGTMAESAAAAGDRTAAYGTALERLSTELKTGEDSANVINEVLQDTLDMSAAMSELRTRLEDSQRQIGALREEVMRAKRESLLDALTGLANRRAFDQQLDLTIAAAQVAKDDGSGSQACLVTSDIDHFKRINDTFGHGFGDQVLRAVSQVIKSCVPAQCLAARIGGEEFAVLLPSATVAEAQQLAEKIRATVARSRVRRQDTQEALASVTVSLGVTVYRKGEAAREFVDRADRALYASKSGGRDRVTVLNE